MLLRLPSLHPLLSVAALQPSSDPQLSVSLPLLRLPSLHPRLSNFVDGGVVPLDDVHNTAMAAEGGEK